MFFKKGMQLGDAPGAVLLLIFIGLMAVVGQKILAAMYTGESTAGAATVVNLTLNNATNGIAQITSQLSLVGLIVIMAIVIGVLWSSFRFGGSGGM
jgi:hypothetical protein